MDITTVLSESMRDVSISQDGISDIFSSVWQESGLTIIVSLILLILSAIFIVRNMRKSKVKNSIKNEIRVYMKEKYEYSGNVCVVRNGISYSRGNRSVVFNIPIDHPFPFTTFHLVVNRLSRHSPKGTFKDGISFLRISLNTCERLICAKLSTLLAMKITKKCSAKKRLNFCSETDSAPKTLHTF